jgi:hypothetical protein
MRGPGGSQFDPQYDIVNDEHLYLGVAHANNVFTQDMELHPGESAATGRPIGTSSSTVSLRVGFVALFAVLSFVMALR